MRDKIIQSLNLPAVSQIGVVVRNIDESIKFYKALGFGPSIKLNLKFVDLVQYGKPLRADFEITQAFLSLGPVEMELVQPISDGSIYSEFLKSKGEGLHHLGFDVNDLDERVERYDKMGIETFFSGRTDSGDVAVAYLDTTRIGGIVFELIQRKARRV